ncbi:polyhydroxyalkanoic acid system family protein [Bacteriovoracaceae bacterium]|nr:polyhydroxyalkanoic acid system family protein [Bacteriovoracaceae bacterium]|tara:strand:+ start:339975 stop:340259 length:285 start_codon:yes stop_codon:yes gene_type:complete
MDLRISYYIAKSQSEAYELAKAQITPEYVEKFKVKADINYNPSAGLIEAKGKGFTLSLKFDETKVVVNLDLSFMLKPFKSTILDTVERKLKKTV